MRPNWNLTHIRTLDNPPEGGSGGRTTSEADGQAKSRKPIGRPITRMRSGTHVNGRSEPKTTRPPQTS